MNIIPVFLLSSRVTEALNHKAGASWSLLTGHDIHDRVYYLAKLVPPLKWFSCV